MKAGDSFTVVIAEVEGNPMDKASYQFADDATIIKKG